MAMQQEAVSEFQGIVTDVLARHTTDADTQILDIQDHDKVLSIDELTYASIGSLGARPSAMGLGRHEHQWGIIADARTSQYAGQIAIIARSDVDEGLIRSWAIKGPLLPILTERLVTDPEELGQALARARSPYLHPEHLRGLGRLTVAEDGFVAERLLHDRASTRALRTLLDNNARIRREAELSARNAPVY